MSHQTGEGVGSALTRDRDWHDIVPSPVVRSISWRNSSSSLLCASSACIVPPEISPRIIARPLLTEVMRLTSDHIVTTAAAI
jgi:hypothetical protein